MVYCGATAALCALEILANSAGLPKGMVIISIEIPDAITVVTINISDLPRGWNEPVPSASTKDIGTKWVRNATSVVLSVPSAVIPRERNYLMNPLHSDFSKITFNPPEPFVFDPRLK
jgi:RES domain-containing protein